jgi:RimJ/RimL family protein N-acetyltransferase
VNEKKFVPGKNINLRDVEEEDAEFILCLRTNEKKSKFLHRTDNNVEKQKEYIKNYKKQEDSWYFIIESKKNREKLGTVRIYDIQGDSFCWGSWIIKDGAPTYTSIESAIMIYEYAFYKLKFKKSHFSVKKENKKVIAFHKRLGAQIVEEVDDDSIFSESLEEYEKIRDRYLKFVQTQD